jgi:putative methyltransferase (TIGR04325 family)
MFHWKYGLRGDYRSWSEALQVCTGYQAAVILEKTKSALLKVKRGEAIYERDSVLFDKIQYAWPVLAGLMWIAAKSHGRLNVLDIGGSLGSTYFQNRSFLQTLAEVRWNIIEQPDMVETGRELFQDEQLRFYLSIDECLADSEPNAIILSSVLQFLEHPYEILDRLFALPGNHVIIIDRTPFWDGSADRLCVQTVLPSIYPASYPSWIFAMRNFNNHITDEWDTIADFASLDSMGAPVKAVWRGMILVRRTFMKIDGSKP